MSQPRIDQRGSAFLMVMFMALPMFVAVGLVVDIGWAYYTRQAAHAAAEAAALAAAQPALDGIKAGGTYTCGSQGVGCYTSTAYTCPASTPNPITSNVQNGCAYAAANGFTNAGPNGQAVTMLANTSSPVVRKNLIRQSNQMNSRETIPKCRAFSDGFRSWVSRYKFSFLTASSSALPV
jgi:Flp pilus assembly protein TadG